MVKFAFCIFIIKKWFRKFGITDNIMHAQALIHKKSIMYLKGMPGVQYICVNNYNRWRHSYSWPSTHDHIQQADTAVFIGHRHHEVHRPCCGQRVVPNLKYRKPVFKVRKNIATDNICFERTWNKWFYNIFCFKMQSITLSTWRVSFAAKPLEMT